MGATKDLYGHLMARVDISLEAYKRLKEEEEMYLLKVYNPNNRKLFEKDKDWRENQEILKEILKDKEEIEGRLRNDKTQHGEATS